MIWGLPKFIVLGLKKRSSKFHALWYNGESQQDRLYIDPSTQTEASLVPVKEQSIVTIPCPSGGYVEARTA
ncbi:hypothetical protein OCU04_002293 [Sclerotinia nivalis]|uniref:Uncharacterized protein n=1 Tax=Sclerotinia nivalis TaxID=352851 RepID=A0A9X0DM13_9HELO|nr:hypothetical protein OCU04_002293 [Sclerotinia nivalis]